MITIADILNQWQNVGVFNYLLPMLFIFALVFGILTSIQIFGKNKMVSVVIAIAIALMSLQWNYFGDFLSQFTPRLAIGLSVMLGLFILVGLFVPDNERRFWGWGLGAIGVAIFIIAITKSFEYLSWGGMSSSEEYVGWVIGGIFFLGLIIAVGASGSGSGGSGGGGGGGGGSTPSYGPWRN